MDLLDTYSSTLNISLIFNDPSDVLNLIVVISSTC